jgi:uncharacterized protein YukE
MSFTLTRDAWKKFKEDNGLTKSSVFEMASVGPAIDGFWKAQAAMAGEWGMKSVRSFFSATDKLRKAFAKFKKIKASKHELKSGAALQIDAWDKQLEEIYQALAKVAIKEDKDLLKADAVRMRAGFKKDGLV